MEKNIFLRAFYLISSVRNKVSVITENLFCWVTRMNLDVNKVHGVSTKVICCKGFRDTL